MSSQWRPLPASLDPEIAYLVGALRELKDGCGLSLAALSTRTAYSKSSWERYLNGRILPPRHAVEALAELTGQPPGRLIALWEQAEARWSGRDQTQEAAPEPASEPAAKGAGGPVVSKRRRSGGWVLATVAMCVAVVALVAWTRLFGVLGAPARTSAPRGYTVGCHGAQCTGREPQGMACALDALTSADLRIDNTYVELRVSHRCAAAWTRVSHTKLGDQVQVADRDDRTETATVSRGASTGQYVSTPMVPAARGAQVRACLQRSHAARRCTSPVRTS